MKTLSSMRRLGVRRSDIGVIVRDMGYRIPTIAGTAIVGIIIARFGGPDVRGETSAILALALLVATAVNPGIGWEASRLARTNGNSYALHKMIQVLTGATAVILAILVGVVIWGDLSTTLMVMLALGFLWSQNLGLLLVAERGTVVASRALFVRNTLLMVVLIGITVAGLLNTLTVVVAYLLSEATYTFVQIRSLRRTDTTGTQQDEVEMEPETAPDEECVDGSTPGSSTVAPETSVWQLLLSSEKWHISRLAQFSLMRIGVIVTAWQLGGSSAGVFAVAFSVGEICLLISLQVSGHFFHLQHKGAARSPLDGLKLLLPSVVLPVAGVVALGWWLIPLVYGNAFKESYEVFNALALGVVGFAIMQYASGQIRALGSAVDMAVCTLPALTVQVVAIPILLPRMGIIGAAWAFSLSTALGASIAMVIMRRLGSNRTCGLSDEIQGDIS